MRRSLLVAGLALATVAGTTLVGSGLAAATGGPSCAKQTRDGKLSVIGLTADQKLVCFKENRPANLRTIGAVTGLVTDTTLVGIDVRPATGALVRPRQRRRRLHRQRQRRHGGAAEPLERRPRTARRSGSTSTRRSIASAS